MGFNGHKQSGTGLNRDKQLQTGPNGVRVKCQMSQNIICFPLSPIPYLISLIPYPSSLISNLLSLIPYPLSIIPNLSYVFPYSLYLIPCSLSLILFSYFLSLIPYPHPLSLILYPLSVIKMWSICSKIS